MPSVNTGTSGQLELNASISGSSAAGRWTDVAWSFYLNERVAQNLSFSNVGVPAFVNVGGVRVWTGSFTFDWRPAGLQNKLIASGTTRVMHNADGTPPASFSLYAEMAYAGSTGPGGPTGITAPLALATLKVLPGVPTGVAGTLFSLGSNVNLSWTHTSASNGQPVTNTIRRSINNAAFEDVVTISAATSAALAVAGNQKLVFGVRATNAAGTTAWSADSAPVFTTPAAPTGVAAAKVGSDISVTWTSQVAFTEHEHVLEHGVDVAGVITWDGSDLAVVPSGTSSYLDVAPNPAQRHVYRVRARNTDVEALQSPAVASNVVQLLTAPNAPTLAPLPAFLARNVAQPIGWTHNSADTSAQSAYEFSYSTNGGSTWSTTGKVTSVDQFYVIAANTYAAGVALTVRVRTWGAATTGGSEGTGGSPWSPATTFTFKTRPVATIVSPANASTYTQATLTVALGFSQAEAATFVNATIGLYDGATLLEERLTTTLAGTPFTTRVVDGQSYTVRATVLDSNGITSAQASSTFSVDYIEPVAAVVTALYLRLSGIAQLQLTIPAAGGGLVAATAVTIDRLIDGIAENIVTLYPSAPSLTFLDTTPTIHGENIYRVTTRSVDGATTVVTHSLVVDESEYGFLSKGSGYDQIVRFSLLPGVEVAPSVESALVKAAGRSRPIGLYSTAGSLVVSGSGQLEPEHSSTPKEIRAFLLLPGKGCYRDPEGHRVFGEIKGSITLTDATLATLSYTVTETD